MDLKELFSFLERLEAKGIMLGLSRVERFLCLLGHPHLTYKTIHIAGTNGKGSTASMIYSVLLKAGYKAGLYTSPHIVDFNERMQVNGEKISDKELISIVSRLKRKMEEEEIELTYFEFITAVAFVFFKEKGVEFAVIETGLGGRLDATNVVQPIAAAITNIGLEHEQYLGKTLFEISREKAGIAKQAVPLFTREENHVVVEALRKKCLDIGAPFHHITGVYSREIGLKGFFQKKNAVLAEAVCRHISESGFGVSEKDISKGIARAKIPGRFEAVAENPVVVLDCAHNPHGIEALLRAIEEEFPGKRVSLVFGASAERSPKKMLAVIQPVVSSVVATSAKYRGMDAEKVFSAARSLKMQAVQEPNAVKALEKAIAAAKGSGVVLVTGSCFLVGEARNSLKLQ